MSKAAWYIGGPFVFLLGLRSGRPDGVLLALAVAVVYVASLRFHPRMRHGACGGSGEHHSWLFGWTHRKDRRCQGGRIIRAGAVAFGSPAIKAEAARNKAARKLARANRSWR